MPWEKQFDIDDVLEKAMKAFWARGYGATSMQDLVNCMGIQRGSIYATYGDKRTLFLKALRRYDRRFRKARLDTLERTCSPLKAIRGLLQYQVVRATSGKQVHSGCFLTNSALELAPHDVEVGKIVADSQADLERFFRRMIEAGQAQGEISHEIDAVDNARSLLGTLVGLLVLMRSRPEKILLDTIVDEALKRLS